MSLHSGDISRKILYKWWPLFATLDTNDENLSKPPISNWYYKKNYNVTEKRHFSCFDPAITFIVTYNVLFF